MAQRENGRLVVLDGTDGSGKATQAKLLLARLKREGYKAKTFDFPHYENFFGGLIGECLAGEYGDFAALDPHIASVLYAADRFESKALIEKWLQAGCVVVLDRYVSANQIHQGGKIRDTKARKSFLQWLDKMEFGIFRLPRPAVIVYLDVPTDVSQKLLGSKEQFQKKAYLRGKKDVVESNQKYVTESRESALKLVKGMNHWQRIACTKKGEMLSREAIAEVVWQKVQACL